MVGKRLIYFPKNVACDRVDNFFYIPTSIVINELVEVNEAFKIGAKGVAVLGFKAEPFLSREPTCIAFSMHKGACSEFFQNRLVITSLK